MNTVSERIAALSSHLFSLARSTAEDTNEAYGMAHLALLRILDKNPTLEGFPDLLFAAQHPNCTQQLPN